MEHRTTRAVAARGWPIGSNLEETPPIPIVLPMGAALGPLLERMFRRSMEPNGTSFLFALLTTICADRQSPSKHQRYLFRRTSPKHAVKPHKIASRRNLGSSENGRPFFNNREKSFASSQTEGTERIGKCLSLHSSEFRSSD